MRNKRIKLLKEYRKLLIEYKKVQASNMLSNKVENKFPSVGKPKQKIKTLYRKNMI